MQQRHFAILAIHGVIKYDTSPSSSGVDKLRRKNEAFSRLENLLKI
jgi:hypothetical protein